MSENSLPESQQPAKTLLVGSVTDTGHLLDTCPHAATMTAWDWANKRHLLIALKCNRWGCRWCGKRKSWSLGLRTELASPNKFLTLTVDPACHASPREAWLNTKAKVAEIGRWLRAKNGECEWLRVIEATAKGWPHYHLVARTPYEPQASISQKWAELTGAKIVDVRQIKKETDVCRYVLKYLGKQTVIPWTNRRVSWTRGFFPPTEAQAKPQWSLADKKRNKIHPAHWAAAHLPGRTLKQLTPTAWEIEPNENDTVGSLWRNGTDTPLHSDELERAVEIESLLKEPGEQAS